VSPPHPSVRSASTSRYLECALTQAASLRLQGAHCDVALATNLGDGAALGRREQRLLGAIEALGVEILDGTRDQGSAARDAGSRFLRDAIVRATDGQVEGRRLWFPNLDCVWIRHERIFGAAPGPEEVGAILIGYTADRRVGGIDALAPTRRAIGELAGGTPASVEPPAWVGADLIGGTPGTLRRLVATCERLESRLAATGPIAANEELMSLAGALNDVCFRDLSSVAKRIQTGPRHDSPAPADPDALGLWHLPAEKGLSLRRAAAAVLHGRTSPLKRDFAEPSRLMRRFNVGPVSLRRRLGDDAWLVTQRARAAFGSPLGGCTRRGPHAV